MAALADFTLEDRFIREEGAVALSGVQALLRVAIDQHHADKRRGLNTATLVSGYRGSPLGGLDLLLQNNAELLAENQITFIPGLNEDLGATAVFGSQLAHSMPNPKYDGVLGMWYGKAPGVDRSGDAIKHGVTAGVDRNGGVLVIAGDDPASKSSTLASESEFALLDYQTPILYPGSVQEIVDYGRWGYELSRYSGLWVSLKIITNVADGYATAEVSPDRVQVVLPEFIYNGQPWQPSQDDRLFGEFAVALEREIFEGRLEATKLFTATNGLNEITVPTADAWLGIVAAGKTYYDVREALNRLGLDDRGLARHGIRMLKLGMVHPIEPHIVGRFVDGLDEVLVVEEKRAFIETFVKDVLYSRADRPTVVGKRSEDGSFLIPGYGELDVDSLIPVLLDRLTARLGAENLAEPARPRPTLELTPTDIARTPFFCSGCPHNRSTVVPEGSEAGGGIGCHGMATIIGGRSVFGITQMGGEGVQWVGAAPFSNMVHRFQNLGDGTFAHSGSLAIRQAIAAGTNITYKILYNNAVAMTGAQVVDGGMAVPELTRFLEAEGAGRTLVLTNDPRKYPADARFADGVDVWHRDRLDEAQRLLRDTPGVTVLIYDQPCAADMRRKRKRGLAPDPALRIFINEEVCEGCGDCQVKSNCLSVQPVETEFGRKTAIHQSSCNKDYSCLDGDCPAFVTVIPEEKAALRPAVSFEPIGDDLPEPANLLDEGNIYTIGIGGTGVVTVNQLLATAALLDGKHASALDQTGLAQKGGQVVSNLKIRGDVVAEANKVGVGEADAYIVLDLIGGTNKINLDRALPDRAVAIVSTSHTPTGSELLDTTMSYSSADEALRRRIDAVTRADDNVWLDAEGLALDLFRSHMPANVIVVGAAWQAGVVPVSAVALEKAIELNGVAVETNIQAFRLGRKLVADPTFAASLRPAARVADLASVVSGKARKLIDRVGARGELLRLLEIRVPELIEYQNAAYAERYVDYIAGVAKAEAAVVPGQTALSEAVARYLYKLMAYKDEYEVARLHLKSSFHDELATQFGQKAKVTYKLHPPMLKSMGLKRKLGAGRSFEVAFRSLVPLRRLRGTALDPFGKTAERKLERAIIDEYRGQIDQALAELGPDNYDSAVELAELPDVIRGYSDLKLANIERWREATAAWSRG